MGKTRKNQPVQKETPDAVVEVSRERIDRPLPRNIEAERAVLSAMIVRPDVTDIITQILTEDDFYRTAHRELFSAIVKLYDEKQAVDLLLLEEELNRREKLEAIGGVEYLLDLSEAAPTPANAEYYARIVREKSAARALIIAASNIMNEAYEAGANWQELADHAEQMIFSVAERGTSTHTDTIADTIHHAIERMEMLQNAPGRVTGLATGFYELDELTAGLQPAELIIIAARPSVGKTSLALDIAEHVAVVEEKAVAVFSLEMTKEQVVMNMLCSNAKVDLQNARTGNLSSEEWSRIVVAASTLSAAPIFIDDSPSLSLLELRAKARRLRARHNIELVVVDYLQLIDCPKAESRQAEISMISRGLKSLARELSIPVLALSQLNRSVESREGHRPRMSDLRESGSLEQDADVIMLLHREEYYDPQKQPGVAEVIVAKQRNGPTATINLAFLKQFTRFENLSLDTHVA